MTTFHSGDAIAARPVSGASLAAFRVVFGAVGVLSMVRIAAYGWIDSLYAGPSHHFHYPGLHWVTDPGRGGTVLLVTGVALSALAVAVGWHTRAAVALFLFGFGWIEAIDVTTYLNHYWFMTIVGIVMLVAPIAATGSLDARRRGGARPVAVAWVWLFRALVGAVYTFAGVAKLRTDWLLDGRPLRLWLPAHADLPVVGGLLADPTTALVASWAGAAFDCLIVALLLWRRTRFAAWLTAVAFHTVTGLLFPIGVFPFLMAGGALIFFAPDWPATVWARVRSWGRATRLPGPGRTDEPTAPAPLGAWTRVAMVGAVALNLVVPLRHLAYPGDARWTGEAYRFSWNVLATEKAGSASFRVTDVASGKTTVTGAEHLYSALQLRAMATEPELVRQAAHALADEASAAGRRVEVRADVFVSLNGRPAARLVDPTVDLAAEPGRLGPQPWILPAPA